MGGGALSSDYVSKLGSKEVSKNLRNFSLAIKKACHCEDERSEDVAIAKSLNINEITTQSSIARNDNTRHAEFISASQSNEVSKEVSKEVSENLRNFPLAPWGEGVRRTGEGSRVEGKCAFTLAEGATHVDTCDGKQKIAFTLAEVLITLGIIGVVAALTLPSIVHNVQKVVLKNQFKRAYSNFYNAIKYVQAQNGAPYACYYWDKNPYGNSTAICSERNEYGSCIGWTLADGSPLPNDYSGKISDCRKFTEDLMKALNVVKFCENNALANGCVTDSFRGVDKIKAEQNPDKEADPNQTFSDTNVKQKYPAFITADGVLYSRYVSMGRLPVFMVDVNGSKGPNKWGYDIFSFTINGDEVNGITKIRQNMYALEKGGTDIDHILLGK